MASILPNFSQNNISLTTIPIAWFLALGPRIWARYAYRSIAGKDIDIRHPRQFSKTVSDDSGLDAKTRGQISSPFRTIYVYWFFPTNPELPIKVRAEAAMANGLDNIGLFAAAVVAGNAAHLPTQLLNTLSVAYVVSRVIFSVAYVQNMPKTRVAAFFGGLGCCFGLLLKAGKAFNGGVA